MSLITVGIPVYNAMPFLPDSIRSVQQQVSDDIDLLIIDDGSTDGSTDYLRSLSGSNVRILFQENSGLTATLNRMLTEVRTPWLVRHDADDIALPNRIGLIREAIAQNPTAGMFYTLASYLQNGRQYGSFRTTIASPQTIRNLTRAGYLLSIAHPTAVLNVAKVQQAGGYRFNLHIEDVDLWWRMALQSDIHVMPQKTVGVTLNLNSVSSSNLEKQSVNCLYVQYLLLSHLWQLRPMAYELVAPRLAALVDRRHLQFREHMRCSQMAIGRGQYIKFLFRGLQAACTSPSGLIKRMAYEFTKGAGVNVSGIDPRDFAARSDQLWPEDQDESCRNAAVVGVPQSIVADKSTSLPAEELVQSSVH